MIRAPSGPRTIALWGERRLKRWPADVVRELTISAASKGLLSRVGLPRMWGIGDGRRAQHLAAVTPAKPHYRVIGRGESWARYHLCIDERRDGRVVCLSDGGDEEMV